MQSRKAYAFIFMVIKPFRAYIFGMIGIAFMWALLLNVQPYIIKTILNKAMQHDLNNVFGQLVFLMGLYLFLDLVYVVVFRIYDWIVIQFLPCIKKHIDMSLMNTMMEHSYSFYQHQFVGSLITRIVDLIVC